MLSKTYTLTIPASALSAAEALLSSLSLLNAADGDYAKGWDAEFPYGAAEAALKKTLGTMIGEADWIGPGVFASAIYDEASDCGESIKYVLTEVFGITLVLTTADGLTTTVPAKTAQKEL